MVVDTERDRHLAQVADRQSLLGSTRTRPLTPERRPRRPGWRPPPLWTPSRKLWTPQNSIGTPTSIGSTSGGSNPQTLTTTGTVPVGALIIVLACWGFGTDRTGTFSGSGLTWGAGGAGAPDQSSAFTSGYTYRVAACTAPAPSGLASSQSITLTTSATVDGMMMAACYVTGLDTSSSRIDGANGTGASGSAWNAGSITTTNAADIVFGYSFFDGTTTSTPGSGVTELFDFQFAGNAWSFTVGYKIVAATGSQNVSGTWGGSSNHSDGVVGLKDGGGGGGGGTPPELVMPPMR